MRRWQNIWATSTSTPTRPSCARAGATRWPAGWPGCSPPTSGSARSFSSTGSRAGRGDLDADLAWQPELWRALVAAIPADPPHIRHDKTIARLRQGPADLPARLSLFGHTRLACTDVELLDALATHHDLHLWLPHPSDELWQALAGMHGAIARRDDTSHRAVGHPLLATLGRDLRELQRSLPTDLRTDEYLPGAQRPDTLLGWLQSDIAANAGSAARPHTRGR